MSIFKYMERVLPIGRGHVPSIPNLTPTELKILRRIFNAHDFASQVSALANDSSSILRNLFIHGLSVRFDQAQDIFQPLNLIRLMDAGLLYEEHDKVKAHFQAQRYSGMIFFSDFFQWESQPDFVLPVGPAGNYLALLTIRRQVELTLDLGCGCGIQSLLAAHHSRNVIAVDINPRALALTNFNAEFNNVHNLETRCGSYFEPVKRQRFDLIVANLPYVITPEHHLIYRTFDKPRNAGLHEWLKEIPDRLVEGGFAQILVNWVHGVNQDPSEPIQQVLENKYLDAWLIINSSKQPDEYAEMWLQRNTQFQRTKQAWLHWYQAQHVERIALGAITLRHRSGARNWFHSAIVNRILENSASEQILQLFATQDYFSGREDQEFLLSQLFTPSQLEFTEDENKLIAYSTHGSRFEVSICLMTRTILQKLDGRLALQEVIYTVARESGKTPEHVWQETRIDILELLKTRMILNLKSNQPTGHEYS